MSDRSSSVRRLSFKDAATAAVNKAIGTPKGDAKLASVIGGTPFARASTGTGGANNNSNNGPSNNNNNDAKTPGNYIKPTKFNKYATTPVSAGIPKQRPHISRQTRATMKNKDLLQVIESFVQPLKSKLDLLDYTNLNEISEETFKRNEKIETFLTDLMARLYYYDAADVLTEQIILGPMTDPNDDSDRFDPVNGVGNIVDFSEEWDRIGNDKKYTLSMIAEANLWDQRYTKEEYDITLQDAQYVHTLLINSMSEELKDEVLGDLRRNFSEYGVSGSLTFAIMINKVINLSESAIDGLKKCLKEQNISEIPGQNVALLTRRMHYGLNRLKHNDASPRNVQTMIFDVMSSSSVPEFDEWIKVYKNLTDLCPKSQMPDYVQLLNDIDDKYKELCGGGKWHGGDDNGGKTAFQLRGSGGDQKSDKGNGAVDKSEDKSKHQQLNIWRPPEKDEAIGDDMFSRVIRKKLMGYCKHCKGKRSGKKGTWTITHFSSDCTSVGGSGKSSLLTQVNGGSSGNKPRANLAGSGANDSSNGDKKKLSFKEQLLAGGESEEE